MQDVEPRVAYLLFQKRTDAARKHVAMTGALGLGIALGAAIATGPINFWIAGGASLYTVAMVIEGLILDRQVRRGVEHFEALAARLVEGSTSASPVASP